VNFTRNSNAENILVHLRDESHRFTITYHRKLRDKRIMTSELDEIPGLGEKRRTKLLKHFGSVDAIRVANQDEISSLVGFNKAIAATILEALAEK
jgi:excinuclease ABC subunit C